MRRWLLPLCLAVTAALGMLLVIARLPPQMSRGDEASSTAVSTDRIEHPHAMLPDDFFAHPASRQLLHRDAVDDALLRAAVFHQTNRVRMEHDLAPLRHEPHLDRAAADHADYLVEHRTLTHENTHDVERRWPMDRVRSTGYRAREASENVARVFRERYMPPRPYYPIDRQGEVQFSYEPQGESIPPHTYASFAAFVLSEWMDSPGHRENILRATSEQLGTAVRFVEVADDLDEAYAVQVFASPRAGD